MTAPAAAWPSLALAFLLELAGLAAFGAWGAQLGASRWAAALLALGVPAVAAVAWGLFASPRAPFTVPGSVVAVQIAFFLAAAAALTAAHHPRLALALVVTVALNSGLLHLLGASPASAVAATAPAERSLALDAAASLPGSNSAPAGAARA